LSAIAGVDPEDHRAAAANPWLTEHNLPVLPPIDSMDQWPAILNNTNARTGPMALSSKSVLWWPYKLVTGSQSYGALYSGPLFPNCSTVHSEVDNGPVFVDLKVFGQVIQYYNQTAQQDKASFTLDCAGGCLFNVLNDPTESMDLASDPAHASTLHQLKAFLSDVKLFSPDRGKMSSAACEAGVLNGGYYGPFVDIDGFYTDLKPASVIQRAKDKLYLAAMHKLSSAALQEKCIENFKNKYQTELGHKLAMGKMDKCNSTFGSLAEQHVPLALGSEVLSEHSPILSLVCNIV